MSNFFTPVDRTAAPFILFSREHVLFMLGVLMLIILLYIFKDKMQAGKVNKRIRWAIIGLLIISEGSLHVWRMYYGLWTIQDSLPFHLCGISIVLSIIMLIKRSYFIFEMTYFWGLIGAAMAIITPALEVTYIHYRFWQFLSAHAFIVIAVMFMVIVEGYLPSYKSIWKTYLATNIVMILMTGVNLLIGSNYLYLMEKPVSTSKTLYDFLGPWPWYIAVLEIIAILAFHIWYLPVFLRRVVSDRKFPPGSIFSKGLQG